MTNTWLPINFDWNSHETFWSLILRHLHVGLSRAMVCRALSECLQSMVLKGMCQLSLLTSKKFHHFFHNWIIEEEHDISGDRWMSHMGLFDSYPVRMGFGFVPKLTCLIYIRQYSACGRFDPLLAALFPWFFVCWFSVRFFTPFLTITLPHFFCQHWVSTENARKKEVWGSKGSLLSSKAYTSLSFGRCEICFSDSYLQVMAPIRPEPWKWSQQYPRHQSVIHRLWLQKQFCSWQRRNALTF